MAGEWPAEKQAQVTDEILEAIRNAQIAARQYESIRIRTCPPSLEFPVDPMIYGHRNVQTDVWRHTYPFRTERSFTEPAVLTVLRSHT